MIVLKSHSDIINIKESCRIASLIISELYDSVETGVTTNYINNLSEELCKKYKVAPAFKGYNNYPYSICASPNDTVVHGFPSNRVISDTDIISIDFGVIYNGWYSDVAFTKYFDNANNRVRRFTDTCESCLYDGIKSARIGNKIGDISNAIWSNAIKGRYNVFKDLVGHGVGLELHEDPRIPNFGDAGTGVAIKPGMVLAIEPILSMGTDAILYDKNGWGIRTRDGSLASHFEHTIVVLSDGPEILTSYN